MKKKTVGDTSNRHQLAMEILRRAKLRAARTAQTMTAEESRAAYDRAAAALQKELRAIPKSRLLISSRNRKSRYRAK